MQGNIKDLGFSSQLHNIVCENNGMQMSITCNNNRTVGGTTISHCFERFGFIWPFSDPWFGFGAVRGSTNPDFMLN